MEKRELLMSKKKYENTLREIKNSKNESYSFFFQFQFLKSTIVPSSTWLHLSACRL